METIPYGYAVPSLLRNEHDGDSLGFLAAITDSVTTIERDIPGYMAAMAMSVATAASSSSGGASCSRALRRHDGASTSQGASGASSGYIVVDDDDKDGVGSSDDWLDDL